MFYGVFSDIDGITYWFDETYYVFFIVYCKIFLENNGIGYKYNIRIYYLKSFLLI